MMENSLPQHIVDKYAPMAKGALFFGHPVDDFTKEELMAMIGFLSAQSQAQSNQFRSDLKSLIGG